MPIDIAAAEKKLLHAEFLLGRLRSLPVRTGEPPERYQLPLEAYFSACLGAAQSAFFTLDKTGGPQFKDLYKQWKKRELNQQGRTRMNRMMELRRTDVHFGRTDAQALHKMVAVEFGQQGSFIHHDAAIFGSPPTVEHVNPDGETERANALRGSVGLYVEIDGARVVEAPTACAELIRLWRLRCCTTMS